MKKHVFERLSTLNMKAVAFSSLLVFAAAGTPALAQQGDQVGAQEQPGATNDQAQMSQPAQGGQPQPGGAQEDQASAGQQEQQEESSAFGEEQQLRPGAELSEMTVGALHGSQVTNTEGEEIGSVSDIVLSRQDQTPHAIVDVGGWLGIGGTSIAVPLSELSIESEDQVAYQTNASRDQIEEQAEGYNEDDYVAHGDNEMPLSVYMGGGSSSQASAGGSEESESDSAMQAGGNDQAAAPQGFGSEDDQAANERN